MKVSASQIELSHKCLRKWAFAYISGLREPGTEQTELGTRVHSVLESYLTKGTKIDGTTKEGAIAQPGIMFLPQPGTGHTEEAFDLPQVGFVFHGYIDWRSGSTVLDHKTTSDFRWAKTPEVLVEDPQGLMYSGWALNQTGDPQAHLRWVYYRTKGKPAAKAVDITLSRGHIQDGLGKLGEEASFLVALRQANIDPLDLPPSPGSCFAYNRLCAYAHKCNLSPLERIQRMQPIGKEALLASLKEKALGAQPVTAPSTTLPGLPGQLALPATAVVPATLPLLTTNVVTPEANDQAAAIAALHAQIAALSAPPVVAPLVTAPAVIAPPVLSVAASLPPALPTTPAKRGPGRPKKDPTATAALPQGAPAGTSEQCPISVLYVNCIPLGKEVFRANDLYQEAHEDVAAATGNHYKMVEFGKGPAVFAQCVAEAAKKSPGEYYVDSRTPEGSDCLETLMGLASQIVRGI